MLALILTSMLGQVDVPLELNDVRITSATPVSLAGDPVLSIRATLKNRGKHPLKLWDPNNTEGSACLFAKLQSASGPTVELQSLTIPRAGGVPTSITLEPGGTITLNANFGASLRVRRPAPGNYALTFIYRNSLASSGPVRAVWTGSVSSRAIKINLVR